MWQRTAIIVALGLGWVPGAELLGEEIRYSELLISDLHWVVFDVAMGRVLATGNRTKHDQQRASRELPGGGSETLAVTLDRGLVSLHYAYRSATRELVIRVIRRDQLEIESHGRDGPAPDTHMVFIQQPAGPVSLTIQIADQPPCAHRAASLWHLQLAHPELCRAHLNQVLRILRPDWQIEDEVAGIRSALFATEPGREATSRQEVERLVAQMSDPDFCVRRSATRALLARGRNVLGFLQELDADSLDAEQRLRVHEIQQQITADCQDTPARVAAWLVNDKTAWLALLSDEQLAHRARASSHLARLCDHPIDFDPEATSAARSAQLADLRTELLRR